MSADDRVVCRTPTTGKDGTTRIPAWKFNTVRRALIEVLAEGETEFKGLAAKVGDRLGPADRARLGSLGWHVTCVKLELEVRGEVVRAGGPGPQRLTLAEKASL